ncbi:Hypothetical protein CINCED_3A025584 [Cinara cedri]|uniref:Uncharacterized protein n=1 Tax=Cinara cedri TaxID=506608 RepID=A0A5E4MP32_9HEMI|nr:Hypothetical protein CINCED_3A025584 [Cinara cedri]
MTFLDNTNVRIYNILINNPISEQRFKQLKDTISIKEEDYSEYLIRAKLHLYVPLSKDLWQAELNLLYGFADSEEEVVKKLKPNVHHEDLKVKDWHQHKDSEEAEEKLELNVHHEDLKVKDRHQHKDSEEEAVEKLELNVHHEESEIPPKDQNNQTVLKTITSYMPSNLTNLFWSKKS